MFDRSEVLRSAWAGYRRDDKMGFIGPNGFQRLGRFCRDHFAYCLRMAWAAAKQRAAQRFVISPPSTKVLGAAALESVAAIDSELLAMELSDARIDWQRWSTLGAARAQLTGEGALQ